MRMDCMRCAGSSEWPSNVPVHPHPQVWTGPSSQVPAAWHVLHGVVCLHLGHSVLGDVRSPLGYAAAHTCYHWCGHGHQRFREKQGNYWSIGKMLWQLIYHHPPFCPRNGNRWWNKHLMLIYGVRDDEGQFTTTDHLT